MLHYTLFRVSAYKLANNGGGRIVIPSTLDTMCNIYILKIYVGPDFFEEIYTEQTSVVRRFFYFLLRNANDFNVVLVAILL